MTSTEMIPKKRTVWPRSLKTLSTQQTMAASRRTSARNRNTLLTGKASGEQKRKNMMTSKLSHYSRPSFVRTGRFNFALLITGTDSRRFILARGQLYL